MLQKICREAKASSMHRMHFQCFHYLQQTQALKKTSRNKYPLVSRIIPAAIEIIARPRFWIDCMLTKTKDYHCVEAF